MTNPTGRSNFADLLALAADQYPDRPALITDDRTITWAQFQAAVERGANYLTAQGLVLGDRLLTQLPTSIELAVGLLAAARAGLIVVPVDPNSSQQISVVAARLAARGILGEPIPPTAGAQPAAAIPAIQISTATVTSWLSGATSTNTSVTAGGEDIAVVGRASRSDKAVMLSHRAILAAVDAIIQAPALKLTSQDRVLLVLPLFHLAGLVTAFLPAVATGAALVIPATPDFNAGMAQRKEFGEAVLEAVGRHHVTVLPGAPGLYQLLLNSEKFERSLASVRLLTSGASPLEPGDFSAVRARTGSPVWEGYGISEAASAVATSLMTTSPRPGSVGLPLPGIEIAIEEPPEGNEVDSESGAEADDDGTLLDLTSAGEPGRIRLRGQHLFSGYWPDGAGGPDADGWFTTGDVGYLDDAGHLRLVDRAAEAIVVAGFTVYPREVEVAIMTHPYVRDVAVIGLPSRVGEDLVALIIPTAGTNPTDEDLTEFLTPLLPNFKRPVRYYRTDLLARTEVGRLDRDSLRREWAARIGIDLSDSAVESRLSVVPASPLAPQPEEAELRAEPVGVGPSDAPSGDEEPGAQESKVQDPGSDEAKVAEPTGQDLAPEPVPDLNTLGTRLPGVQGRTSRSARDTDDDLF